MAASMLSKKVRISKNRKKYWKKHVDLKDVEEFLEEKRLDERFGGPVADKPDEKLFVLETKGSSDTTRSKGRLPPLRCFQILQPDSAVPPPVKPPQSQGKFGKDKVKTPPNWVKNKTRKLKKSVPGTACVNSQQQQTSYDLWTKDDDEEKKLYNADVDVGYLPDSLTRKTIKVPEYRYQKSSLLPAVETPHPGASYNPTYSDHQALMMEAHLIEVKHKKEEDHLDRCLTKTFPKVKPTEESWLKEMSAGLFDGENEEGEKEENDDETKLSPGAKTWGQPVSFRDRKIKAVRNLEKVRKREKRKVQLEKIRKRRLNDLQSVKSFKKQIVKAETVTQERIKKREKLIAEKMYQPRRLGPCKYLSPDLEVKLGEELPDNLRTLKAEGDLMEDRFKSLQRRNLIEPRTRQKAKKRKMKVFVPRSHRD